MFRPSESWARAFLYAALDVLGIGGGLQMTNAFLAAGLAELRDVQKTAFLIMEWVSFAGFVWTAVEAFAYHAQLKKRLALGLVDPVVVNRIGL